jgi:hypothetical protein
MNGNSRMSYDVCSYKQALKQSIAPIDYTLDPIMYEHQNKCRMERGLVGGTNVSHITGNLVDLENNLRGQTHPLTHCPSFQFNPKTNLSGREYIKPVEHPNLENTKMNHLRTC